MEVLYFPLHIYERAHQAYLIATGQDPAVVMKYCIENYDFFVEVAFSYVEGTPFPEMKVPG